MSSSWCESRNADWRLRPADLGCSRPALRVIVRLGDNALAGTQAGCEHVPRTILRRGHVLLCPGTHQGTVRGSAEHGLGIDGCGGSGISENVASCRG
jgi:hypothetical protein